jgi:hypothetical protein
MPFLTDSGERLRRPSPPVDVLVSVIHEVDLDVVERDLI